MARQLAKILLVDYLHEATRYAESIPLLEQLVVQEPGVIKHRVELMIAYDRAQRPRQLQELLDATVATFSSERILERAEHRLARLWVARCNLKELAAGYYKEAISLHQRHYPQSTGQDNVLSDYYQQLADLRSQLKQTGPAVEAALGAIACWSSAQGERTHALQTLERVLFAAEDLDQLVRKTDTQAEETGHDHPVLRKAIGGAYEERKQFGQAIAQLQIAARLQPEDKETHERLIRCYDASMQPQAAVRELLALAEIDRRDPIVYQRLTERMQDNPADAERSATSIVEAAPAEAETHISLARLEKVRSAGTRRSSSGSRSRGCASWNRPDCSAWPTRNSRLVDRRPPARPSSGCAVAWPARFAEAPKEIAELEQRLPK